MLEQDSIGLAEDSITIVEPKTTGPVLAKVESKFFPLATDRTTVRWPVTVGIVFHNAMEWRRCKPVTDGNVSRDAFKMQRNRAAGIRPVDEFEG